MAYAWGHAYAISMPRISAPCKRYTYAVYTMCTRVPCSAAMVSRYAWHMHATYYTYSMLVLYTCYERTVLGGDGLEVEPERADDAAAIDDTQHRNAVLARARHLVRVRVGVGVGARVQVRVRVRVRVRVGHQRLGAQRDGRVDEAWLGCGFGLGLG